MRVRWATGAFAIIPEWILDAEISDRAVRLFCLLARYADLEGKGAYPSRNLLAQRLRCSTRAVTDASNELVAVNAVAREPRFRENGSQTTNSWVLLPGGCTSVHGGVHHGSTPETEPSIEKKPNPRAPAVPSGRDVAKDLIRATSDHLARSVWTAREAKPCGGKFVVLRARIEEQLLAGRTAPELARVLPRMTVFSRDAFDYALNGKMDAQGAAEKPSDRVFRKMGLRS